MKKIAFKVDIDTYEGISTGLPTLRKFFQKENIKASFFVTFGPDYSGWAIFRVLKRKGFLNKMFRTKAVSMYGWKTILSGILLPPHMVGISFPKELQQLAQDGHEVGIHSWHHTRWHDYLPCMSLEKIESEFRKCTYAFQNILGYTPQSVAAAGWMATAKSLYAEDYMDLLYASDSRGKNPFFPKIGHLHFHTLQIPTTLPTYDEVVGRECTAEDFHLFLKDRLHEGLNVHTIHTETEGMSGFPQFEKLVDTLKKEKVEFVRLIDEAKTLLQHPEKIPTHEVVLGEVPGRATLLACQVD